MALENIIEINVEKYGLNKILYIKKNDVRTRVFTMQGKSE